MSEQLVNTQESSIDTDENTAKAPRWVNIVAKAAALTCALSWGFGSIWIFVRGLSAIRCIFAAVCMLFNSFLILCIEASIFLGFSEFAQPFIRLVSTIKMYQKALYYIISSTVIYIMCSDAWMANAFGYGMSIVAGVTYGYGVMQYRKQARNHL